MHTWRLIDSGCGAGAGHMALDEALLLACADGAPPTLRLFAFQPPALTLGRFQAALRDVDSASCEANGLQVVRRPTGGRAVLHTADLCYAIVAPKNDPQVGGSIRDSYCRLSEALTLALAKVGAPADCVADTEAAGYGASAACFALAAPYELQSDSRKLVGSAQVRSQAAFLQQGSVRLAADSGLEAALLGLEAPLPALSDVLGHMVSYDEMALAMRDAFAECFGVRLERAVPTPAERNLAAQLEREKYADAAWTWQR